MVRRDVTVNNMDIKEIVNELERSELELEKYTNEEEVLRQKLEEIRRKKAEAEAKKSQSQTLADTLVIIRNRLEDEDDEEYKDAVQKIIDLAASNLKYEMRHTTAAAKSISLDSPSSSSSGKRRPRTTTETFTDNICYRVYKDEDEIVAFIGFSGDSLDQTSALSQQWKEYILSNRLAEKVESDKVRDTSPVTTAITNKGGAKFLHQLRVEIKGADVSNLDPFEDFDFSKQPPDKEVNESKKPQILELIPQSNGTNGTKFQIGDKVRLLDAPNFVKKEESVGKESEVVGIVDEYTLKVKIPDVKGEHRVEIDKVELV